MGTIDQRAFGSLSRPPATVLRALVGVGALAVLLGGDKTLVAMSGKLSTTNDLLRQANAKLDASGAGLARMQQTLGGMGPDIHAMTQKITHAKLLF